MRDSETRAQLIDRIVRAADVTAAAGIRVIRVGTGRLSIATVLNDAVRVLRTAGFVAIRAGACLPRAVRQEVTHRHVVLFATGRDCGPRRCERLSSWIHDLAAASPRAHLLVVLEPIGHLSPDGGNRTTSGDPTLCPVDAWGPPLVRDRASQAGSGCLHAASSWLRRCAEMGAAVTQCLGDGRLEWAESIWRALAADAFVRRECLPPTLWLRCAELSFWRGRFDEAAILVDRAGRLEAEAILWHRLTQWGASCSAALDLDGLGLPPPSSLTSALTAQERLSAGDAGGALRQIEMARARRSTTALERALLCRIEVGCLDALGQASPTDGHAVDRFVCRTGARGILRWGLGRAAMNLLHGLSTLLEVVQEAEDECAALRHGCAWVRQQASADAVGIVATDGTRLLAGEGIARADLHDPEVQAVVAGGRSRAVADAGHAMVGAPVRYGGSTIGFVIARGRPEASESLAGAAKALAAICAPAVRARLDSLALSAARRTLLPEILGRSPAMATLREGIARAAGTTFPVLVEGESGTGKELVARAVHRLSARRDRRFAALNCAALTDDLAEAELFGHARGAFTGALSDRAGLFEESHGSTLFLDEVAELSARAQAKLLRVLQEREIRRVGEHLPRRVDVRLVAATNLPLAQAVGSGRFREDLLFRLAVVRIRVPPLRDRVEDIPLLAQAFWRTVTAEAGSQALLGVDATAALCRHRWPGNVRELQNVIAGLVLAAPARGRVGARHVGHVLAGFSADPVAAADLTLTRARRALESRMIAASLARHGGRCSCAARELGLSRQGLAKAMKRLGLEGRAQRERTGS